MSLTPLILRDPIDPSMDSMANNKDSAGSLSGTTINFFGPAKNVNNADETLAKLQNRSSMLAAQRNEAVLHYMSHVADPVGGGHRMERSDGRQYT